VLDNQKAQGPPARQNVDLAKPQFKRNQNSSAVGDITHTQNSRAVIVSRASNPNIALSLSTEARGMNVVSVPSTSAGEWFDF
jgi:hypothetical protein